MKIKAIVDTYSERTGGFLEKRFGEHYAQICTVNTLKVRSAILDTARYMDGKVRPEIALLCSRIEKPPQGLPDDQFIFGYEGAGGWVEGSIHWDPALIEYVKRYPEHWKVVARSLKLQRATGRHASAYALADEPIQNIVPVTNIKGYRCTAVPMKAVEYAGILKYDLLLVNSLKDIQLAIRLIQERSGVEVPTHVQMEAGRIPRAQILVQKGSFHHIYDLPEDPAVFEDIVLGRTISVFQFDSSSARKWLPYFAHKKNGRYLINSIQDMAVFTALDRPGPLKIELSDPENPEKKHNALVEYTRRARGLPRTVDILPVFDELFPETYGVMLFQEQLSRAYRELTGCSSVEAEEFRSEVGKKEKEKILKRQGPFIERVAPKYGQETALALYKGFETWSEYGFSKNHSVPYCMVAYTCAYLKRHFPVEWWCAVLQNATKDEISERFWPACKRLVELPSAQYPSGKWEIRNDKIFAPIGLLKGVGAKAEEQLAKYGPYAEATDLCQKIQYHRELGATTKTEVKQLKKGPKITLKKVLGRSSVTSGTVYTLIAGGAMDGMLPGMTLAEKLGWYESVRSSISGEKLQAVKPKYTNLSVYEEHLLRKSILPMAPTNLTKMMVEAKNPMISSTWGFPQVQIAGKWYRLMTVEEYQHYSKQDGGEKGFFMAIGGMVKSTRTWRYGEYKENEACELIFEVDGEFLKFVKWPNRKTKQLDQRFGPQLEGCLAILLLNKWQSRDFNVSDIVVIEGALKAPESGNE